jgi:predicted ABC-type sugar transport system permease subunit
LVFSRLLGSLTKIACVLAVLVGIGWGVWRGMQHAFYQNPDFRLTVLDLNPTR